MAYWTALPPGSKNLRLLEPGRGWRQHDDEQDASGATTFHGAVRAIELALSTALNSSNLLILTGAGSSFSAKNDVGAGAPGMRDLWNAVLDAATPALVTDVVALIPKAAGIGENIEKLLTLSKLFVELFDGAESDMIKSFVSVAEKAILDRVDFVRPDTDIGSHRAFIRKIARRGLRKPRARIFTTNYDLCFEQAAQQQQFVLIDGFSRSTPQVYDRAHFAYDIVRRETGGEAPDYIENVVHLYKLHGSLDWRRNGTTVVRSRSSADGDPTLIFPRDSKYQEAFDVPYLDMMGALQLALREPETALIISGFGFNDDHISGPVMAAVEANMSLRLVLCDVAFLADTALEQNEKIVELGAASRVDNPHFKRLRELALLGDKRITLLNGRFEDMCVALPDLVAETERERHFERVARTLAPPGMATHEPP